MQDFVYQDQMMAKKKKVMEVLNEYFSDEVEIFGEKEYEYRTRMDFVISENSFGLRRKRKFDQIEELDECYLINSDIFNFLKDVRVKAQELGIEYYDLRRNEGFWRYLSLRINEKNEFMLILVTSGKEDKYELIDKLMDWTIVEGENLGLKSVCHLVNDTLSDSNFGVTRKYLGEEYLVMVIADLKIVIGPNNFFQNNMPIFNRMLDRILSYINQDDRVLDLYCGVGTLTLPLAKTCNDAMGVEEVESSIEVAKNNAQENNIDDVKFEVGRVEEWLKLNLENLNDFTAVVIDPPRVGLEKACDLIMNLNKDRIIYVSCNPLSLVKDLSVLSQKYVVEKCSLWDLYPQTPHVETLCLLKRKD